MFPNCKGWKQCAVIGSIQMMRLNLRQSSSAVLGAQRTLCLDDSGHLSAFPTSFYHKYCGIEVTVHRVMQESMLLFLGTFCHREENLKSLGLFFLFWFVFFFFFPVLAIKLMCLKNKNKKIKPFRGYGKVEWPQCCDFWALKGTAALLSPTNMDAVCCAEISPKLHVRDQKGS